MGADLKSYWEEDPNEETLFSLFDFFFFFIFCF